MTWLSRAWCRVTTGHQYLQGHADKRVYLRCTNCGHQTPGWDLSRSPRDVAPEADHQWAVAPIGRTISAS